MAGLPRLSRPAAARPSRAPTAAEPTAPAQPWRVAQAVVEAFTLPFRQRHTNAELRSLDARMRRDVIPDEDWRR